MPFHVIRGTFHVVGYSPDGDSIRFRADNIDHWDLLDGPPARLNAREHAQLRLEAIDTLETHYENQHQPLNFAQQAMVALLTQVNITNVVWNAQNTVITQADDGTPGYIISREVEKNRRPVSFAFTGEPPRPDGARIFLTAEQAARSVNAAMLRSGLAYPTYYKGLFPDLREALTAIVAEARAASLGIWPDDRTNHGFDVTGLASITEDHVILPKLFRRLASFLRAGGTIDRFIDEMRDLAEEIFIISSAHFTHFDTILHVDGNVVRMTEPPENVIFMG